MLNDLLAFCYLKGHNNNENASVSKKIKLREDAICVDLVSGFDQLISNFFWIKNF